jgi:hypothetical protein
MKYNKEIEIDRVGENENNGIIDMLDDYENSIIIRDKRSKLISDISTDFKCMVEIMAEDSLLPLGLWTDGDGIIRLPSKPEGHSTTEFLRVGLSATNWIINNEMEIERYSDVLLHPYEGYEYRVKFEDFSEKILIDIVKDEISKNDEYKKVLINHLKKYICGSCGNNCNEYTYNEETDADECNDCKKINQKK